METFEMEVGGRKLIIEHGKMAKQANGAVLVRYGDTVVLVTATASKEPREGVDFFPLTVDYEEKMYAAGKIPGGFIKREGRPSSDATLCARLIDRPIRPLFPKGYRNDVQIVATVLSVEPDNAPELAGMIGASCALSVYARTRPPVPSLIPPNQRVTVSRTFVIPLLFSTSITGRPAVPEGSPSSEHPITPPCGPQIKAKTTWLHPA